MANNHMGSFDHGLRIIDAMSEVSKDFPFNFAVKLQYRDLDTLVHRDYRTRFDLKFVKRFSETRLSWDDYRRLKDAITDHGFVSICTPSDENAVDRVEEHGFDIIKTASCGLTDWPLLERIVKTNKPLIASTAGASLEELDRAVSFLRHREKQFSLMHCVGDYPTRDENLNLNQIVLLRERYPGVEIGHSTHEQPDNFDAVKIAIGMGASIFEKHVGLETPTIKHNSYSAGPVQLRRWLDAASAALAMCGVSGQRYAFTEAEMESLRALQRGVFARRDIAKGDALRSDNVFYAIPIGNGQVRTNDMSKYTDFVLTEPLSANQPALYSGLRAIDRRAQVYQIISDVKKLLKRSKVAVPGQLDLEISHHFGIEQFGKFGSTFVTVVNREYCKRVILMIPGQCNPEHYHKQKDETFHVLYGEIQLTLDGVERRVKANEVIVIPREAKHSFQTSTGSVIEEVSSAHQRVDSFYTDPAIQATENRKTFVTYWMD
jgi:sialic acid synthase SpsE/quercetin dioxygenase-like cupin family protein